MTAAPAIIRRVMIRGRVQRVGFRAFVEYTAADHGLAGWVRNCRDGSVEALFAGTDAQVDAVIAACRRGPASARVEALDQRVGTAEELAMRHPGETFSVLPTR
jgi:acylphosphatase